MLSQEKKELEPWRLYLLGAIGFAVEYAWTAGEALIIPYLIDLGYSLKIAGMVYVVNPVIAFVLQPVLGKLSDRSTSKFGKRRPFIIGLTVTGVVGHILVIFAKQLSSSVALSGSSIALITFLSFGLADISHDCILAPLRSLVSDLVPLNQLISAHSKISTTQMIGRLFALLIGLAPLYRCFPFLTADPQIQSQLFLSMCVLSTGCLVTCISIKEIPGGSLDSQSTSRLSKTSSAEDSDDNEDINYYKDSNENNVNDNYNNDDVDAEFIDDRHANEATPLISDETEPEKGSTFSRIFHLPSQMYILMTSAVIGWIATMSQMFYWTQWIGLANYFTNTSISIAYVSLLVYSVMSIVATVSVSRVNRRFGTCPTLMIGELCLSGALFSCYFINESNVQWASLLAAAFLGVGYGFHSNNIFVAVETFNMDPKIRGISNSLMNNTMTIAQIITGGFAGLVIEALGDSIVRFYGVIGLGSFVLQMLMLVLMWRYNMFSG